MREIIISTATPNYPNKFLKYEDASAEERVALNLLIGINNNFHLRIFGVYNCNECNYVVRVEKNTILVRHSIKCKKLSTNG